jgi:hypothetical protein
MLHCSFGFLIYLIVKLYIVNNCKWRFVKDMGVGYFNAPSWHLSGKLMIRHRVTRKIWNETDNGKKPKFIYPVAIGGGVASSSYPNPRYAILHFLKKFN